LILLQSVLVRQGSRQGVTLRRKGVVGAMRIRKGSAKRMSYFQGMLFARVSALAAVLEGSKLFG
jgi:hypothetical protein